jgi:hypothetical protein
MDQAGNAAPRPHRARVTSFRVDFIIRETCDDGSVADDDLRHIRFGEDLRHGQLFDAFNRYRDAIGLMFPPSGPMVLALVNYGPNKIQVIKVIREITGLGLKEAKDLVEAPGDTALMSFVDTHAAELASRRLAEAGAQVRTRTLDVHNDIENRRIGLPPVQKIAKVNPA